MSNKIKDYIEKLYGSEKFEELDGVTQEKVIFTAEEILRDTYKVKDDKKWIRAISLQVLYMIEGDLEEFMKLIRFGIDNASTKGVSVNIQGKLISPEVERLLGKQEKAGVGRLW